MRKLKLDKAVKRYMRSVTPTSVFKEIEQGKASVVLVSESLMAIIRMELQTMVIVAIKGSKVYENRDKLIELARANGATRARFHTKYPERLEKATAGLPIELVEVRPSLFGRDEYVYSMGVL